VGGHVLRAIAGTARPVPTVLIYSARRWEDLAYRDEILRYAEKYPQLTVRFLLTRQPPRRHEDYGRRIDGQILKDVFAAAQLAPKNTYICGSNGFVNNAAAAALQAGCEASLIRTERFGGAAQMFPSGI
jgi:ferredoxin-NADP reductase